MEVDDDGLDGVARAFADIIDAKSPFTFRHSTRVATIARRVAARCGLDAAEQRRIYRAGLLHDIGKLGISSLILDKDGAMTPEEREQMERHPQYTLDILERVSAFRGFARTAALHHERLDGSGYPFHYDGEELDLSARILVRRRHLRRDQLGPAVPEGDGAGGDHVDPRARSRHAALSRRARRAACRARGDTVGVRRVSPGSLIEVRWGAGS